MYFTVFFLLLSLVLENSSSVAAGYILFDNAYDSCWLNYPARERWNLLCGLFSSKMSLA